MKKKILAGGLCICLSFILLFYLSIPTMNEKAFSFSSTYKDESVTLKASLWEAKDAEYGVLICPGYSCDRQKWRPFADLFVANGYTTMSFDYAGQGASSGTIGFDNAKTDNIPLEISDAIEVLKAKTGFDDQHIILVGHSMGGRSILRLLSDYNNKDAETNVPKQNIANVILISPEVNYHFNAQASLFAGTSDDVEEPWHSYNETYVEGTNVYLYGSIHDDIVSDEDVYAIYKHIGGSDAPDFGVGNGYSINGVGSSLTVGVTSGVLHSYEMYSPKFAAFVNDALSDISGKESSYPAGLFRLIYAGWFLGLIGLALMLSGLNENLCWKFNDQIPELHSAKDFLIRKVILWILGIIAAFLICCITVVMPFGSPVMNTPYMCFIAGYGVIMLLAYRKGHFKGTEGKLPKPSLRFEGDKDSILRSLIIGMMLSLFLWYGLHATMFRLIPLNYRLFWVLFATVIMTVGYYVSGVETDMLEQAGADWKIRLAYSLIQYIPLFLLVGFYLILKSYSGLIGQVQNMILMYSFCIPLGNYIKKKTGNRLLGAAITAFLFQTLMITSAALIAIM